MNIKVKHPNTGKKIIFEKINKEQKDVLNKYTEYQTVINTIQNLKKQHGNDFEFGSLIRELTKNI